MTWTRGDNPFDIVLGKYQVKNILEHVKGDSLLDLGCNDGRILRMISSAYPFAKVVGVDSDPDKIAEAKKVIHMLPETPHGMRYITYMRSTIEDFEAEDRFSTIILINVLEHVKNPLQALRKAAGLLTSDGVLIIHVPNAFSLNRRLGMVMKLIRDEYDMSEMDTRVGHKRFYDPYLLRDHIHRSGLEYVSTGGVFLKPFSNEQMQRITDEWVNAHKIFDGLYEMAREMPECSSPIWAVCKRSNNGHNNR